MSVYSLYVISDCGSLQFFYDHYDSDLECERKYDYPLPFQFKNVFGRLTVDFGMTDDVKPGFTVISVNNILSKGTVLENGDDILKFFGTKENFPLTIKFGRPRLRPNDRIHLAGMFQPLHQMARHFSPISDTKYNVSGDHGEKKLQHVFNSGIQTLETPFTRIHCFESTTGVKFILVTDIKLPSAARESLRRVYEAYTDYVLKNPFYAVNQPFNFEFFTNQVKFICDQVERGIYSTS